MKKSISWLTVALVTSASLLLIFTQYYPLWTIELYAPQYPEGLFMYIWSSKITGDVHNVNILNHYIGMKAIDQNSIPELRFLPPLLMGFLFSGLSVAVLRRKLPLMIWGTLLVLFAVVSFFDFYLWGYDYGHDLSPDAPIKMEGESYQPPLLGKKEIMNIVAWSLPNIGGIAFGLSIGLALSAMALELGIFARILRRFQPAILPLRLRTLALFILPLFTLACTDTGPVPIDYGHASCHSCRMKITDRRFGAQAVTRKGKVYNFDSIECMLSHLHDESDKDSVLYVPDASEDGKLIPAKSATFTIEEGLRGPMGKAIFATRDEASLRKLPTKSKDAMKWSELIKILQTSSEK